jgi:hypothetical protein
MTHNHGTIHNHGMTHNHAATGTIVADTGEHGIGSPAASASVALDIGDGLGALVIMPSERFRGREIEISRVDDDGPRVHTGVHERASHVGSTLTAIFGSLPAGQYVVWEEASTAGPVVEVPDGAVAQIRLN